MAGKQLYTCLTNERLTLRSTPRPITDSSKRIFACLAGRPDDPTYDLACKDAFESIVREGQAAQFTSAEKKHRRGHFPALATGISYGKGQKRPTRLDAGVHSAMLRRLVGNQSIERLATYASGKDHLFAS